MTRRRTLPGADELFRSTGEVGGAALAAPGAVTLGRAEQLLADDGLDVESVESGMGKAAVEPEPTSPPAQSTARRRPPRSTSDRRPTGRERHDEKITVYVSADELLDLEHARLTLRGDHGLAVDRGRIVREALAYVLADLEAKGGTSILVRRVRGR